MAWGEMIVTGHDPTPSEFDLDMTPDQPVFWATTSTNLVDELGVFADASWRAPIFSMEGVKFFARPMFSTGKLLRQGVYVRQPDGSSLLCTHLVNITGDDENPYYAYELVRSADGWWVNTGPDNRRAVVEFEGLTPTVVQELIQKAAARADNQVE